MSYDISLTADVGGPYPISLGILDENYTWNLGDFFEWFLGKRLGDFNGEEAWLLREAIERGFEKFGYVYGEPPTTLELLQSFEPENKWGSVPGAICFLSKVFKACILAPNAKVSVN